ncbi:copper resistance protein NlpE [Solitalea koreensis]|nr:copper resistance protein NlpE [Solitalea koreensis]
MKLLILISAFALLVSCQLNQKKEIAAEKSEGSEIIDVVPKVDSLERKIQTEVYEGILPCADCEGIKTKITFYVDTTNAYEMEVVYIGRNDNKPIISTGKYTIEFGYGKDIDAALYVLNYNQPGHERYFVKLSRDPRRLIMLDRNRQIIYSKSKISYKLTRKF